LVQQNDIPERVNPNAPFGGAPPPESGGNKTLLKTIVITLIVSLAVVLGYTTFFKPYPPLEAYTKDFTNVASDIKALQGSLGTVGTMQSKIDGIPAQVEALKNQFALKSEITAVNSKVDAVSSGMAGTAKTADLNIVKESVANLANNATVKDLQSQTKALTDTNVAQDKLITDQNKLIATQADAIKVLQGKVALLETPTTTNGTTTTGTGITATIIGSVFAPTVTSMNLPAITALSTVSTGTFTIQVNNPSTKTLNGVQLAVSLGVFDNTNPSNPLQFSMPAVADVTVNLSSAGNLSLIWTQQNTGVPYILGFVNQVNTGNFAFGNLSIPPGTSTFTQTLTLTRTPASVVTTPSLIVLPSVKVIAQGS